MVEKTKDELKKEYENLLKAVDFTGGKKKLASLKKLTYEQSFWSNHQKSSSVLKEISSLEKLVEDLELIGLLLEENELKEAASLIKKYNFLVLLSGKYDANSAIFSLHAGQGGTEAMDWTDMLFRMYTRYFDKKGWDYKIVDEVRGEEAGIKSITLEIHEKYAYGYLKGEAGVHRLVRQSPFNADKLRQTSFSLVEVLPILSENDIKIKEEDLEWQFFRSGGHGGQNVNKVSTAVRLIYKPKNIVVTCQSERYQKQNREIALSILRSKLWKEAQEEKAKTMDSLKKDKIATWGKQIRSYVLHPYKMIKDLRTGFETSQVEKVLDGEIDEFINSYLYWQKR